MKSIPSYGVPKGGRNQSTQINKCIHLLSIIIITDMPLITSINCIPYLGAY